MPSSSIVIPTLFADSKASSKAPDAATASRTACETARTRSDGPHALTALRHFVLTSTAMHRPLRATRPLGGPPNPSQARSPQSTPGRRSTPTSRTQVTIETRCGYTDPPPPQRRQCRSGKNVEKTSPLSSCRTLLPSASVSEQAPPYIMLLYPASYSFMAR